MSMSDDEHTAMVKKALDAIPGYPFLSCPICKGVEGCDHSVVERATAYEAKSTPVYDHDFESNDGLDGEEDREDLEAEMNCGMWPDGQCGHAGTEYCDMECPYRD